MKAAIPFLIFALTTWGLGAPLWAQEAEPQAPTSLPVAEAPSPTVSDPSASESASPTPPEPLATPVPEPESASAPAEPPAEELAPVDPLANGAAEEVLSNESDAPQAKPPALEGLDQQAPQILSTDLLRLQWIQEPIKRVTFVLLDQDLIVKVRINGQEQTIVPAHTLSITKKFRFQPGKTLVTVVAEDEAGHQRSRSFLVGYKPTAGVGLEEPNQTQWKLRYIVGLDYELDDNPTLDLSSPIAVGELEIKGVVDDAEQADYRTQLKGLIAATYGDFNGLGGAVQSAYDKPENEPINSQILLAGVGWKLPLGGGTYFKANYLFTDVNVGGYDYSQNQGLSPGFLWDRKDEGDRKKHYLGLDLVAKSFASSSQSPSSQVALRWDYSSTDAEKDQYKSRIAVGTASEGTTESEQSYSALDFDWHNQWSVPFWDLGFGIQQKRFANEVPLITGTALGDTRVDLPIRFSTAVGLQFSQVMVKAHYHYHFNLSNKVIYVRTLTGLAVQGVF